jgi:hypothetical protein
VTTARLDRVSIFSNKLTFLIPHEWIEEEEEGDYYLYHLPNADSGWFRVSLITLTNEGEASKEHLHAHLMTRARNEGGTLHEHGENIVLAWEQPSEENGIPICSYWWAVARSHGPSFAQEALFSYTILRQSRENQENREMVCLLAQLVADAQFAEYNPNV